MKRSVSALFSNYVIDGTRMDCTPAQMLEDCMASGPTANPDTSYDSIVDEIVDPVLKKTSYDTSGIPDYIEKIRTCGKKPGTDVIPFPSSYTARKIAAALLSVLWKKGHFTLEDLEMEAAWKWDCAPLGNMAAFFFSVEKASSYMFDLGIRLKDYTFDKVSGYSDVDFSVGMENTRNEDAEDEYDFFNEKEAVEMRYRWISDEEKMRRETRQRQDFVARVHPVRHMRLQARRLHARESGRPERRDGTGSAGSGLLHGLLRSGA